MLPSDGVKCAELSEEETKIRKEEDKLFAKMAELPTTNNAVMLLLGKEDDDNNDNDDGGPESSKSTSKK